MPFPFESYKKLRNHLRKVDVFDSLYVFWAFVQHLQFGNKFPADVQVPPDFLFAGDRLQKGIQEWELETLVRETLITSAANTAAPCTFKDWNYLRNGVNKLKSLEEEIAQEYLDTSNVLIEMSRVANRQFPWQQHRPASPAMTRYFKIFSTPEIDQIVFNKLGLSTKELYLTGFTMFGYFLNHFAIAYPPRIEFTELTQEMVDKFLAHFSKDMPSLKEMVTKEQSLTDQYVYTYSSLRAFPLIKAQRTGENIIMCPLPTIFFWRVTGGLYYELLGEPGFDGAFGTSFQTYVGEVLNKCFSPGRFSVHSEQQYGERHDRKDSIDWIVDEPADNATLFIECKTKRMIAAAKTELELTGPLEIEADKITKMVVQVYKSISDYKANLYPHFPYSSERVIFPVIVTLEDWIMVRQDMLNKINEQVREELIRLGLPVEWLDEIPYSICCVSELEAAAPVMNGVGIKEFMGKKMGDKLMQQWTWHAYMQTHFPTYLKNMQPLFPDDFKSIFPDRLT